MYWGQEVLPRPIEIIQETGAYQPAPRPTYRKTYKVVGYVYDADVHCLTCAHRAFGPEPTDQEDTEGNPVSPLFLGDCEPHEYCADCFAPLAD